MRAAHTIGCEALILGRQGFGASFGALADLDRQIRAEERQQQLGIDARCSRQVGQFRTVADDAAADFAKPIGQPIQRRADALRGRAEGVGADQQRPEAVGLLMPRWWQRELVPDPLGPLVGSRQDVELKGEIGCSAGHRADHREIATHRHCRSARWTRAALGNQIKTGLVSENAAIIRRSPQ